MFFLVWYFGELEQNYAAKFVPIYFVLWLIRHVYSYMSLYINSWENKFTIGPDPYRDKSSFILVRLIINWANLLTKIIII